METSSISTVEDKPPQHQVFINFRGADLRRRFVSHLVTALKLNNINVFIDDYEDRGQPLDVLLKRIEESKIVLAIFSGNYTESVWCVRELEKIKDCTDEGTLVAIPIFYKLEPSTVRDLKGKFGDRFRSMAKGDERKKKWKEAFNLIPNIMGIIIDKKSVESEKVNEIVKAVKTALTGIPPEGSHNAVVGALGNSDAGTSSGDKKHETFGNEQRLKDLEEKLDRDKYKGTRIIGVVGMPGIGKTTLLKELYKTWQGKFSRHALIDQIRVKSKHLELDRLPQMLLGELSKLNNPHVDNLKDPYSQLHERKVLVVLDDVSKREQIDALREILDWIKEGKEGSRVVIATSDMSLTNGLVDDTYMVQNLNHRDSLQLFHYHAFIDDQANPQKKDFMKLSEGFVHYARGHPLALKVLGGELNKKSMDHWNSKMKKLAQSPSPNIVSVFQVSYDELTTAQKDAFLDIACFRSQDKDYVESLLASSDLGSAEAMSAVKSLTDKFLINTCDGRVEMHDLLYKFSREVDLKASNQDGSRQRRLWLHQHIIKGGIINVLQNKMKAANVRGIFLDLSEVEDETSLDRDHFINMGNLRYLKFYNSHCPQECKTNNKINIPDKLKLPLKEVRCLHWLKFPLETLPNDFNPINLVDLKLPYSEMEQLWEGDKDTPCLRWVDLNHSSKLCSLSGLSKAEKLQRLNLEGCTTLKAFPHDMKKMKMLAFLNLKGCTSLESLPEMNLISLKTLTLSGCSTFKEFPLISDNIETLYLDGTAISQLPMNMEKLQRLVVLNMKDCKMLEEIPGRVGELKALQELILSDCLNLKIFPEIDISFLNILLLDGTAIEVMPQLPSVQYLCLSRNAKISCLPVGISQLSQLKWLDLKYCTSLTSVPEFPPNLQCLDAHGCSSLKTVSKPLARIMPTEQNHSTFIFTNCENLEQAAKEEITSYAQRKCQLLSYARKRHNGGLVSESLFSTCFPGCEVPSWFCHETVGSELEVKLLPHWHDKKLAGIALCAVVSCLDPQDQVSRLSVTCTFKVKDEDKSWVPYTCPVGSWTRHGGGKDKIELDHVFIGYTSCPHTIKCHEEGNSDECNPTEASLKFTVTGGTSENGKYKVLKCGLSLVYAKDKDKNSALETKYDMLIGKSFQETSEGVDGRVKKTKGKYVMPVEKNFQETTEGVDGRVKKKKKTRMDNGRPKKKQRSGRDDNQTRMQVELQEGNINSVIMHTVKNF
uniref:Inactive disease resistance protein RPS4 n=1 Tax=Arabidopsis thaliana TaxID=3702 RepID=RPS4R_ARATH|nr:RecName: Full=Inactive disease resistance protein RPS4; AltName: Full=Resistance to Pseudomonas syringae 4 [Arabidopsis thaliana]CAB53784.1 disease resistance protein rps4-RLD [Arabidopsis thaliana]